MIKGKITTILIVAISLFIVFFVGRCSAPVPDAARTIDTVSMLHVDTVRYVQVQYRDRWRVRTDTLIQVINGDTVFVPVPIDRYTFTDDTSYRAVVSGYNVSLDRLDIFRPTIERTITIREPARKRRFGLGLQCGYGISMPNGTFHTYIGVGISYNFLTF